MWKACGKPRSGNVFQKCQKDKYEYRKCYREHQISATSTYTNDLHESLRNKDGKKFWKTSQSKIESKNKFDLIDGSVDKVEIAEKFAKHFSSCSNSLRTERAK